MVIDLIWPVFGLLGIETVAIKPGITAFTPLDFVHYPWTHSLLMCTVWAFGPVDRVGYYGLWGIVILLLLAYAGAAFDLLAPSVEAIAWTGLAGGVVTAVLGYRVDRHCAVRA